MPTTKSNYNFSSLDSTKQRYDAATINYMIDRYRTAGFTDIEIAGMLGNVLYESGFNHNAVNKSNGRWGLYQWGSGQDPEGKRSASLDSQIQYSIDDINHGDWHHTLKAGNGWNPTYYKQFKAATTPYNAAVSFGKGYERYTPNATQDRLRGEAAELIFKAMNNQMSMDDAVSQIYQFPSSRQGGRIIPKPANYGRFS